MKVLTRPRLKSFSSLQGCIILDDNYMTIAITNLQQETAVLDSNFKCKTSRRQQMLSVEATLRTAQSKNKF